MLTYTAWMLCSRSRKNGISMEIPAELEGILDPSKYVLPQLPRHQAVDCPTESPAATDLL